MENTGAGEQCFGLIGERFNYGRIAVSDIGDANTRCAIYIGFAIVREKRCAFSTNDINASPRIDFKRIAGF
jgi:hypothetical protein